MLGNNQEMVEVLVRRGAELNQADREGVTPLALAVRSGQTRLETREDLISLIFQPQQQGPG